MAHRLESRTNDSARLLTALYCIRDRNMPVVFISAHSGITRMNRCGRNGPATNGFRCVQTRIGRRPPGSLPAVRPLLATTIDTSLALESIEATLSEAGQRLQWREIHREQ